VDLITCLEHQSIPVRPHRQPGEFALTHAQASQLDKASNIPRDAFRWGNQSIQWRQYCGVVQLNGLTLEILPKVHGKEANIGACKAVLVKLLRRAGLMKMHRGDNAAINTQTHTLLDIFITEFCRQLREQTVLGKPRAYQQSEANLGKLKGRLLTNQQLRRNLIHQERLYCRYDELSENILINQTIKFTLRLLLPQCRGSAAKKIITEQLMRHDEISDLPISTAQLDRIVLNRTNDRYERILDWCRLFITASNPDVTAGKQPLMSLLFDMNRLFEHWLAVELRPLAREHGCTVREQAPRRYLAYRNDLEVNVYQTRPDISLIDSSGTIAWLLDAKWKLLDGNDARLGINQSDLYQMSAYANLYAISRIGLIYPRQNQLSPVYTVKLFGARPLELIIVTVDIERSLRHHSELRLALENKISLDQIFV